MDPHEKKKVYTLMKRCFPVFMRLFLSLKGTVFLACSRDTIIGGIVVNTLKLPQGRRMGIVSWIFTSQEARGKGAARLLLDQAMDFFSTEGCSEAAAIIEGYNTPSSNRFAGIGFTRLSARDQVRLFGLHLPKVMLHTLHFFDIGHYLWYRNMHNRDISTTRTSGFLQWICTAILLTGIMTLVLGLPWSAVLASVFLILGIRHAAIIITWKLLSDTPAAYRCWGTGTALSICIALLFGGVLPAVGGIYPRDDAWSIREYRRMLGISGAAGSAALLLSALVMHFTMPAFPESWQPFVTASGNLLFFLILFDALMPFFPFSCFSSRRILEYSRGLYAAIAVLSAGILYLMVFMQHSP